MIPSDTSDLLHHFFDKILVVSVRRFTDRHREVTENLKGLPFEFAWGTDKLDLNMDQLLKDGTYDAESARKVQRMDRPLKLGEIACSLSHRSVYEAMIRNNWNRVLILEDDVLPLYERLPSIKAAIDELPKDWELVYFGYLKHEKVTAKLKVKQFFYKIISSLGLMKWSYKMVSNLLPRPFSKHLRQAGFHDCTHAYAVTLEGAKKLVKIQTPVVYRADDLLSYSVMKGDIKGFVTEPKFFDQLDFHTTETSKIKS